MVNVAGSRARARVTTSGFPFITAETALRAELLHALDHHSGVLSSPADGPTNSTTTCGIRRK
jgi:hypothetical protein